MYIISFIDLSNFNTENVSSLSRMFEKCTSLTSLDLSSFNTKHATSISSMFFDCFSLEKVNLKSLIQKML